MELPEIKLNAIDLIGHDLPWEKYDGLLVVATTGKGLDKALAALPRPLAQEIATFVKRFDFEGKPRQILSFDSATARRVVVAILPSSKMMFPNLEWARRAFSKLKEGKSKQLLVDLRTIADRAETTAHAIASTIATTDYQLPTYRSDKSTSPKKRESREVTFAATADKLELVKAESARALTLASGTNLVRKLSLMPGNTLTATAYVELSQQIAKSGGLKTDFLSLKRLQQMGAGAFLAVAQGSEDRGGGILKVIYQPAKKTTKRLALVGKGITYDTGGNNLKTGQYMFGMNQDMAGSAVALATALVAAHEKWPFQVTAYLAITDNILGPKSYRPNDVVKSLKGVTIEVVDTDAEGRMVLADALALACEDKPDLIIDFATLTGACIRAIGTRYSGIFSNRRSLYGKAQLAGAQSGERVWPFPSDPDYARCLKSTVADIRQCRLHGGVDHIEASHFLKTFVSKQIPWVHVDLSAANHDGGLGHVGSRCTGFGVRFATRLTELLWVK